MRGPVRLITTPSPTTRRVSGEIHEHACVRCPLLRPDPAQRARLIEIGDNLRARIEEARREGWLGEMSGLEISLAAATRKLGEMDELAAHHSTVVTLGPARNKEPR